jgi:hypothetical protein
LCIGRELDPPPFSRHPTTLKRKKTGAAGNPAAPLLFFIMINDVGTFVNRKIYNYEIFLNHL